MLKNKKIKILKKRINTLETTIATGKIAKSANDEELEAKLNSCAIMLFPNANDNQLKAIIANL